MSSWLQAKLKAAEGLLEGFDKTVSGSLGLQADGDGEGDAVGRTYAGRTTGDGAVLAAPWNYAAGSQQASASSYSYANQGASRLPVSTASYNPQPVSTPSYSSQVQSANYTAGPNASPGAGYTVKPDAQIPFSSPPKPSAGSLIGSPPKGVPHATASAVPSSMSSRPSLSGSADHLASSDAAIGAPYHSRQNSWATASAAATAATAASHHSRQPSGAGSSASPTQPPLPQLPTATSHGSVAAAPGPAATTTPAPAPASAGPAPPPAPGPAPCPTPGPAPSPPTPSHPAALAGTAAPTASAPSTSASTSTPVASALPLPASAAATAATIASATNAVSQSLLNLVLVDNPDDSHPDGSEGGAATAASASASSGREAQLSRTCEQLRKRLEASRLENEQLEDMLARAEVRAQQEAALVGSLREELAAAQQARSAGESSLAAQLAAARAQLAELSDKYEVSQRRVLVVEGQLAALEESSRRLAERQSDMEGGMVEALKAEASNAETRLEAERKAHHASRAAAAARERDLEQQIAGSMAALTDLQRSLDDSNRKHRDLEDKLVDATKANSELATQVAALQQQLLDAGLDLPPGLDASSGGAAISSSGAPSPHGSQHHHQSRAAAAAAEMAALRQEAAQLRRAAQAADQARAAAEARLEAALAEASELRHALSEKKDTAQLEAQVREMSDMLYLKQTQLERLAADKAAQQIKTERELDAARQELAKLRGAGNGRGDMDGGAGSLGRGGGGGDASRSQHDIIPMDALGEPYQRLARHNKVGKAVKAAANFLDSTAGAMSSILRHYPLGRLFIFGYVIVIHLYVYFLLARMQRIATRMESAVVAAPT